MSEIQCVIGGKVQGTQYRAYVQESATTLGLVGYVKNQSDGTVFVCAQGSIDTLKEFIEYLHEGSVLSTVESVGVDWVTASKTYYEFSLLY